MLRSLSLALGLCSSGCSFLLSPSEDQLRERTPDAGSGVDAGPDIDSGVDAGLDVDSNPFVITASVALDMAGNVVGRMLGADVTADGRVDIIIAQESLSRLLLLRAETDGRFSTFALPTGPAPHVAVWADVMGDSTPELTVLRTSREYVDGTDFLEIYRLHPEPRLELLATHSVGRMPRDLAVADFNLDGKSDLIVANARGDGCERCPQLTCGPQLSLIYPELQVECPVFYDFYPRDCSADSYPDHTYGTWSLTTVNLDADLSPDVLAPSDRLLALHKRPNDLCGFSIDILPEFGFATVNTGVATNVGSSRHYLVSGYDPPGLTDFLVDSSNASVTRVSMSPTPAMLYGLQTLKSLSGKIRLAARSSDPEPRVYSFSPTETSSVVSYATTTIPAQRVTNLGSVDLDGDGSTELLVETAEPAALWILDLVE